MCEGQLEEEEDDLLDDQGEHTPARAPPHGADLARRVPMPPPRGPVAPPVGQPEFQLEQLQELERKLEEERQ
jgi:hypothetical protein